MGGQFLGSGGVRTRRTHRAVYDRLYRLYRELHDSFGGLNRSADLSRVMKALIEIKYAQRS